MSNNVLHFYRADAKKSSRINSQIKLDGGEVLDEMKLLDPVVLYALFKKSSEGDVFVFHQQSSLINLALCFSLNIFMKKVILVYDIHDILEFSNRPRMKDKVSFVVFSVLEGFFFKSRVNILTVSDGLSRIFYLKYNRSPKVFYNIPQVSISLNDEFDASYNGSCVYFGLINELRLPIDLLEFFKKNRLVLDVYGIFFTNQQYQDVFNDFVREKVIRYLGEYEPDNIVNIVSKYTFSIIYIPDERVNIRFCLPNKLFQSLFSGVRCVISNNLSEVKLKFAATGSVLTLSELKDCDLTVFYDSKVANEKIELLRIKSNKTYISIVK